MHSFLVGARYNRANCVDAKGVSDFGVYMARNNPLTCFLSSKHPSSAPTPREEKPAPHHPPSSPESLNSTGSSDRSASPSPPPSPTRRPQQAWMQVSSSRMPRQEPLEKPRRPTSGSRAREHVLNLNNELNVKDFGNRNKRTRAAFALRRPSSAHATYRFFKGLPSVYIQGTAMARSEAPLGSRAPSRNSSNLSLASSSSVPMSLPSRSSQSPNNFIVQDFSKHLDVEALFMARRAQLRVAQSEQASVAVPVNQNQDGYISPVNSPSVEDSTQFDFFPTHNDDLVDRLSMGSEEIVLKDDELNPPETDALELAPHEVEASGGSYCAQVVERQESDRELHSIMKTPTPNLEIERPKSRVRFRDELDECPISDVCTEEPEQEEAFFITEEDTVDTSMSTDPGVFSTNPAEGESLQLTANQCDSLNPIDSISPDEDSLNSVDDSPQYDAIETPPHILCDNSPVTQPMDKYTSKSTDCSDVKYEPICPQLFESVLVPETDSDNDDGWL